MLNTQLLVTLSGLLADITRFLAFDKIISKQVSCQAGQTGICCQVPTRLPTTADYDTNKTVA